MDNINQLKASGGSDGLTTIEQIAVAAGLLVTQKAIDKIWGSIDKNKPYNYAFNVDTLKAATKDGDVHTLADGDTICIKSTSKESTDDENDYHIKLKQKKGEWWKAITAHNPPNKFDHEIAQVHDKRTEDNELVSYSDMFDYFIVLSKAKAFGVHVNEYWIKNSYHLTPDKDWIIEWQKC